MITQEAKTRTLIISLLGGALAGLGFGFFLIKRSEENDLPLSLSTGEGLSLAFMILGFARQLGQLGDGEN